MTITLLQENSFTFDEQANINKFNISNRLGIDCLLECIDKKLIIRIKDNGVGIPRENLNKIFTVGYTTKGVGVGTGLGLAISQKIIAKHNGEIRVNSELGVGTEFIITLNC